MASCILVHGGAGPRMDDDDEAAATRACLLAAQLGKALLDAGKSALDAVEAAVRALEDDPRFNAGTGAALTAAGTIELDASIMDGATLGAGAVTGVSTVKNPVLLARRVLEATPHVLLAGASAEAFARDQGFVPVDPASLVTERARRRFEAKVAQHHGTVGAVALDERGHVAAATSTGGTHLKRPGRIGDTPLIGCGTYADDGLGAASATGKGEAIIKVTLTRHALDLVHGGADAMPAAREAVETLGRAGGDGGLILVTPGGELGWALSTERMARGWVDVHGVPGSEFLVR